MGCRRFTNDALSQILTDLVLVVTDAHSQCAPCQLVEGALVRLRAFESSHRGCKGPCDPYATEEVAAAPAPAAKDEVKNPPKS